MKIKKLSLLGLSLIMALPLVAGCGEKAPSPGLQVQTTTPSPAATTTPTTPPAATTLQPTASATTAPAPATTPPATTPPQTRVVLAEMFTGDW
jgi:hypothetical protein